MAAKAVFVICAQALFIQMCLGQVIYPGSTVTGNSVVDNNIVIGGGYSGLGLGGSGIGLAGSGIGLAGSGIGLAGSGIGLAGSGLGVAGSGFGLAGSGLGLGASGLSSTVAATSPAFSSGVLAGLGGYNVVSSGPLTVTTVSPIGPSGLAVASENVIEGILTVNGQLPYLSAVAFEGALPTSGSGVATCGCGSGNVGIVSEGFSQGGFGGLGPIGVGQAGLGQGFGYGGLGQAGLGLGLGGLGGNILY